MNMFLETIYPVHRFAISFELKLLCTFRLTCWMSQDDVEKAPDHLCASYSAENSG